MKIAKGFPPNIETIKKVLPIKKNTVFTYGDTIYIQELTFELPEDLIVHEQTHEQQQAKGINAWWDRYLRDPEFRFNEELAAYRKQYQNFKMTHTRHDFRKFARIIAKDLSSAQYGYCVDFNTALDMIKS